MTPHWDDVNVRARGLATHLLSRTALESLAQAPDLPALGAALVRLGFPAPSGGGATAAALEQAVRRAAARRVAILARWCGERTEALALVFEDEDRRSVRAVVRGALQGAPAERRLAACVPTPALPERALGELARQTSPAAVAALLVAWGNPYGGAVLPEARLQHPDLFRLETAIQRAFARRALGAARGRALVEAVRETIDLENACSALLLAAERSETAPGDCFVEGGRRIDRRRFEGAARADGAAEAARRLAAAFAGSAFAPVFLRHGGKPGALEAALLPVRIAAETRALLRDPLGPAPVLAYALRLRAETADLGRIVWGIALGAPAGTLSASLLAA